MANTRIQVPLDAQTREALQTYADARGTSLAAACSQILTETAPVMLDVANALQEANTAPARAMKNVTEVLDKKIAEVDQARLDLQPHQVKKKTS